MIEVPFPSFSFWTSLCLWNFPETAWWRWRTARRHMCFVRIFWVFPGATWWLWRPAKQYFLFSYFLCFSGLCDLYGSCQVSYVFQNGWWCKIDEECYCSYKFDNGVCVSKWVVHDMVGKGCKHEVRILSCALAIVCVNCLGMFVGLVI